VQLLEAKTKEPPVPEGWMTAREVAEMYFLSEYPYKDLNDF